MRQGCTGETGQLSLGRRLESLHRDDLKENLKRGVDALLGGREDMGPCALKHRREPGTMLVWKSGVTQGTARASGEVTGTRSDQTVWYSLFSTEIC